ncbi:MAG: NADH-quinone oxidoreductase subunit C [Smithellaceae bacterium]|nr:NADH-quinone oxidoreductase subunit C [Smithellaceae bacterium]
MLDPGRYLMEKYPLLVQTSVLPGMQQLTLHNNLAHEVLGELFHNPELRYDMLTDLFGVDRGATGSHRFEVVYLLTSLRHNRRLSVRLLLKEGETPSTVSDIWQGANWLEREAYDMFGLAFSDHPDLRRILLEDDFTGHPLRKDYPTAGDDFDRPFVVRLEEDHPAGQLAEQVTE